jgi:sulfur-carrier protein
VAHLKFFGRFRSYVSSRELDVPAGSVREALGQVWAGNPKLREAMLEGETLRPYVRVMINGRHVELAQGLDTPLTPEDEVAVFSPVAGGGLG